MKRLPLVASFVLFIALCASVAYWAMQLFKPPLRPVAAPPQAVQAEIRPDAAATLFGGSAQKAAVASNYQLKGIIFSGSPRNSVAILSADGKPAQAVRVETEVAPGVTVKEVHREYVLLSDNGATKRVELPENAKGQVELANLAPVPVQPSVTPPGTQTPQPSQPSQPSQPIPTRAQAAAAAASQGGGAVPGVTAPATAVPGQPPLPGTPPAAAPTGSPIPPGAVPSVQLPPTAPPTVVVSPPPSTPQAGATTAPPAAGATAGAARTAPSATSAAPATPPPSPAAPATRPGMPPRPSSPDTAPLISR